MNITDILLVESSFSIKTNSFKKMETEFQTKIMLPDDKKSLKICFAELSAIIRKADDADKPEDIGKITMKYCLPIRLNSSEVFDKQKIGKYITDIIVPIFTTDSNNYMARAGVSAYHIKDLSAPDRFNEEKK
jgi:hypothetical protein